MNDHDIVTIDQKQKLINKTEKYKNTRKKLFSLLEKHYGMKKFLNSTTHQRRRAYSDVDEESAPTCHPTVCWYLQEKIFSQIVVNNFSSERSVEIEWIVQSAVDAGMLF